MISSPLQWSPARAIAVLTLCGFLSACATIKTGSHYDETTNFGAYRTFSWLGGDPYISGDSSLRISPLTQRKIQLAIQAQLEQKGYSLAGDPDGADFLLAYTVGTRDKITISSYPVHYYENWGWHIHGSYYYVRETREHSYTEGTLGVDIFDGVSNKPVWHGWAEKTITDSDRRDPDPAIEKGVAQLFEAFPR